MYSRLINILLVTNIFYLVKTLYKKYYLLLCRNNVEDISQVQFLGMCTQLNRLTLESNPVCVTPSPDSEQVGLGVNVLRQIEFKTENRIFFFILSFSIPFFSTSNQFISKIFLYLYKEMPILHIHNYYISTCENGKNKLVYNEKKMFIHVTMY